MAHLYEDFDLKIVKERRRFRASVLNSPAGQAEATFALPSRVVLENYILRMARRRSTLRRGNSIEMSAAKALGEMLFEAVFREDVGDCFRRSLAWAQSQQVGLRLKLRVGTPELLDIPWEYLFDRTTGRFLSVSEQTPVVRYVEMPQPVQPLAVDPPLSILAMVANPANQFQLDVQRELDNLHQALSELEKRDLVQLDCLESGSLTTLHERLLSDEYHVLHFIGHGAFDVPAQEGVLLLEGAAPQGDRVSGERLAPFLLNHQTFRLVVLNSCEGARTSLIDPFSSVAMALIRMAQIPAVAAMQFDITDEAAVAFARGFYAALATGRPVDAALASARLAVFATGNDVEWGTPTLYMRSKDGVIFDLPPEVAASAEDLAEAAVEVPTPWPPAGKNGDPAWEMHVRRPSPTEESLLIRGFFFVYELIVYALMGAGLGALGIILALAVTTTEQLAGTLAILSTYRADLFRTGMIEGALAGGLLKPVLDALARYALVPAPLGRRVSLAYFAGIISGAFVSALWAPFATGSEMDLVTRFCILTTQIIAWFGAALAANATWPGNRDRESSSRFAAAAVIGATVGAAFGLLSPVVWARTSSFVVLTIGAAGIAGAAAVRELLDPRRQQMADLGIGTGVGALLGMAASVWIIGRVYTDRPLGNLGLVTGALVGAMTVVFLHRTHRLWRRKLTLSILWGLAGGIAGGTMGGIIVSDLAGLVGSGLPLSLGLPLWATAFALLGAGIGIEWAVSEQNAALIEDLILR